MTPQAIQNLLGIQLTAAPTLHKLMKYDYQNTYVVNDKGELIGLNLRTNNLTDEQTAFIWELKTLQALNLSENKLSTVHIPKSMKWLKYLNLSENPGLHGFSLETGLPSLEEAYLSACAIQRIYLPEGCSSLKVVELQQNQLATCTFNSACPSLERLDLCNNQLTEIKFPSGFEKLYACYLNDNALSSITFQGHLPALNTLHLKNNQLTNINGIENLPALKNLYLNANKIEDVQFLAASLQLHYLNLSHNKITDLSPLQPLIVQGRAVGWKEVSGITLEENPLNIPPPEIVKEGRDAVLNYFTQITKQGTDTIYEAKLLIVGEGGAGKTSLCRRLFFPEEPLPGPDESTRGIDIHHYTFPLPNGKDFRVNVWDFGGQEIYHATHQFFLTRRSLYILVDDTRKDYKTLHDDGFKYWLEVIELLGKDSPVLIFQNEKSGRSKAIDFAGIKGRFEHVIEKYQGDLKENGTADELKDAVEYHVKKLPHIGESLPAKWIDIRKEIEGLAKKKPYISQGDYCSIYAKHLEDNREEALHLSRYLHDLGVFLHFQDDTLLKRTVILQNTWATEAVFKILDDEAIKARMGRFDEQDCERVWKASAYADMHPELMALMIKFELCYRLPGTGPVAWLAPQLLPPSKPETLKGWEQAGDLALLYEYDFLPKGIINRLMVRQHYYVQQPDMGWKNGVLFEKGKTQLLAQVSNKGGAIILRSRGPEQKELLSGIAANLDALNDTFPGLAKKVKKLIPCICEKCKTLTDPDFYEYDELVGRREADKPTIECRKSWKDVEVRELLDGIHIEKTKIDFFMKPDFGWQEELKGLQETLGLMIRKKNFLEKELAGAYDTAKKFKLQEDVRELEGNITGQRQKMESLLGRIKNSSAGQDVNTISAMEQLLQQTNTLSTEVASLGQKMEGHFDEVKGQLHAQDEMLLQIISLSEAHQQELKQVYTFIGEGQFTEQDMEQMAGQITMLLDNKLDELPQRIGQEWKALQQKPVGQMDAKGKFKLKVPFIPGLLEYEKELSWDFKPLVKKIWSDLKAGKVFLE
jgi:internalin A